MATYTELSVLSLDTTLLARIASACAVQADVIRLENVNVANHVNRMVWAKEAFADPRDTAKRMIWAVLAANRSFTTGQISGASDAALLTAVSEAVDVVATGA